MSEKEVKKLEELAQKKLDAPISRDEAMRSLQNAGILNSRGDFTEPYQNLARVVTATTTR